MNEGACKRVRVIQRSPAFTLTAPAARLAEYRPPRPAAYRTACACTRTLLRFRYTPAYDTACRLYTASHPGSP